VSCVQRHASASQVVDVCYWSDGGRPISETFRPLCFESATELLVRHTNTSLSGDDKTFVGIPEWIGEEGALAGISHLILDRVGIRGSSGPPRPFARRPNNLSRLLQRLTCLSLVKMTYVLGEMVTECLSYMRGGGINPHLNPRIDRLEIRHSNDPHGDTARDASFSFAPAPLLRHYPMANTVNVDLEPEMNFIEDFDIVTPAALGCIYRLLHVCRPQRANVKGIVMEANGFDEPWDEDWVRTQIVLMHRHPNHSRHNQCIVTDLRAIRKPLSSSARPDARERLDDHQVQKGLRGEPSEYFMMFDLVVSACSGRLSGFVQPPITA